MKTLIYFLLVSFSSFVLATPEIKGDPAEIETYLMGIPKIISITAQADEVASSSKARIWLSVETEAKALSKALQQNRDIRIQIRKKLADIGITGKEVSESKFSSTPEYGFFGDLPKSYKVNNTLSVLVDSEEKMIGVANISDLQKGVRYLSSKPELVNKDEIYRELTEKALNIAKEKVELYQQKLGVKLVPVYFDESVGGIPVERKRERRALKKSLSSSLYEADAEASFGSSKLSLVMTIQYRVYPSPINTAK